MHRRCRGAHAAGPECPGLGRRGPRAIGAIRLHPYFVDKAGEPMSVTMDAVLSPDLDGVERLVALTIPAMKEALAPLGTPASIRGRIPAFIGLPEVRPGRPPRLEDELTRRLEKELAVRSDH